eukprot:scaffold646_cov85-Alexandrium_tamarense.AAC.1
MSTAVLSISGTEAAGIHAFVQESQTVAFDTRLLQTSTSESDDIADKQDTGVRGDGLTMASAKASEGLVRIMGMLACFAKYDDVKKTSTVKRGAITSNDPEENEERNQRNDERDSAVNE